MVRTQYTPEETYEIALQKMNEIISEYSFEFICSMRNEYRIRKENGVNDTELKVFNNMYNRYFINKRMGCSCWKRLGTLLER